MGFYCIEGLKHSFIRRKQRPKRLIMLKVFAHWKLAILTGIGWKTSRKKGKQQGEEERGGQ